VVVVDVVVVVEELVKVAEDIVVEIGFVASVGDFSVVSLVVVSRSALCSNGVV